MQLSGNFTLRKIIRRSAPLLAGAARSSSKLHSLAAPQTEVPIPCPRPLQAASPGARGTSRRRLCSPQEVPVLGR